MNNKHYAKSITASTAVIPAGFLIGSIANVGTTDATVTLAIADAIDTSANSFVLKPNMVYDFEFCGKPYGEVIVFGSCELVFIY